MLFKKIRFAILLAVLTIITTIALSQTSLLFSSRTLAQTSEQVTPATLIRDADDAFNSGNDLLAEELLRQALAIYCVDSGLLRVNLLSRRNIEEVYTYCSTNNLAQELANSNFTVAIPQVIFGASNYENYTESKYEFSLEMANAFRKFGDIYLKREIYDEALDAYQLSRDMLIYQNLLRTSGLEERCGEDSNFPNFLESLYELGSSSFETYTYLSNEETRTKALDLTEEVLISAMNNMVVFAHTISYVPTLQSSEFRSSHLSPISLEDLPGSFQFNYSSGRVVLTPNNFNCFIPSSETRTTRLSLQPGIESEIAGLLQKVLVIRENYEQALAISDLGRTYEVDKHIAYNLVLADRVGLAGRIARSSDARSTPSYFQNFVSATKEVAIEDRATLISYSIVSDKELFIWIVQPNGQISVRSVLYAQLIDSLSEVSSQCISINTQSNSLDPDRGSYDAMGEVVRDARSSLDIDSLDISSNSPRTNVSFPSNCLQLLYQILVEPIKEFLPTDPNDQVVFVPHGSIFFVPFPALQSSTGEYLIQSHTIRVAPNLRTLVLNHANRRENLFARQNALVVGNPDMPSTRFSTGSDLQQLPELPEAELEAVAIEETLGEKGFEVRRLTKSQATEETVVRAMRNKSIIHLATHSLIDNSSSNSSTLQEVSGQIALAPSQDNDGWLTALDLLQVRLSNTDLVVLSACNTAQGQLIPGGVIGLPFSLSLAGVPSIVASLWAVPDTPATTSLMKDFYGQILSTNSTVDMAQALRQAMLNTMQEYPEPRYWAGFTLIGSSR